MSQPQAPNLTSTPTPAVPNLNKLAALPLLASTHFCMDVLLRGSVLDLRSASEVLTFDPCALLRLFALVAEECTDGEDSPQRLDECIIALGKAGLAHALYQVPSTWQQQARLSTFAEHAVIIARCARLAAIPLGLCEQTAAHLGLLHAIGTLPAELGWTPAPPTPADLLHTTELLIALYRLPASLGEALLSVAAEDSHSLWSALIEAAHQLAEGDTHTTP